MFAPKSKSRLVAGLGGIFLATIFVYLLVWEFVPQAAIPTCIAWAVCVNVYFLYRWRIEPPVYDYEFRELRALAMLSPLIRDAFLPFSSWAMEPEALYEIIYSIQTNQYKTIVECGAGVSTILIGHLLKKHGEGHLYTLEEDERWYNFISGLLVKQELTEFVTLVYAPLQPYPHSITDLKWYDTDKASSIRHAVNHVDLLLVDGPKSTTNLARFPALHFFDDYVDDRSLVILDDANRPQEQAVLSQWQKDFGVTFDLHTHTKRGQAYIHIPSGYP